MDAFFLSYTYKKAVISQTKNTVLNRAFFFYNTLTVAPTLTLRSPRPPKTARHLTYEQQFKSFSKNKQKEKHPFLWMLFFLAAPDRLGRNEM